MTGPIYSLYMHDVRAGFNGELFFVFHTDDGTTGLGCRTNCTDVDDGDYQSCESCVEYISCSGGQPTVTHCNNNQTWDDNQKRCQSADSTTCLEPLTLNDRGK